MKKTQLLILLRLLWLMQGKVAVKPHGYAGDFELIDNIYTNWISPEPLLAKWDHFFHSHAASKAVRNRKQYFIELLKEAEKENKNGFKVLSVGSGPARDIHDFIALNATGKINFDCVDMDSNGINYSKPLTIDLPTWSCPNQNNYL